jgi:hypothetical protein
VSAAKTRKIQDSFLLSSKLVFLEAERGVCDDHFSAGESDLHYA